MVTAHARPLGRRRLDRSPRDPGTARGHPARALRAGRSPRARRAPGRDHKVVLERGARAFGFDRVMERWGVAASLRRSGVQRAPSGVLGLLAFWAIFLFFASAGVDAVALPGAHSATALLLAFLPPLFAALR